MTCYDRDGNPLPDDWWDRDRHDINRWRTERRVAVTEVDGILVSTVWLHGIDHNWGGGPPLIFETMVFGAEDEDGDHPVRRYSTEEQAIRGHIEALDRIRNGQNPFGDDHE